MSLDRSLRTGGGLTQKRSVLTRAERLERLKTLSGYDTAKKPAIGLPKTNTRGVTS